MSRSQLVALGVERGEIQHRLAAGRLRLIHRGIYAVGHDAIPTRGRLVAGLLVAGGGSALSHRTAAGLWKLTSSLPPFVELTTTKRAPRARPGLVFHHATSVDATARHELPVTTPIRTLRDLAATRPRAEVERACGEALILRLVTEAQLATQDGPGAAILARLTRAGVAPTRSQLECAFLDAVSKFNLPRPLTQHRIGRYTVDFYWPSHNLVVETDGARFHDHAIAIPRDNVRDAELQLRGCVVLRFTWHDVVHEPERVAETIARFLSRPASSTAS